MVIAYHATISCYGFWLPNDPRGSGSDYVRSRAVYRHGEATKVITRRSVAGAKHDVEKRIAAKSSLCFPPVALSGVQARAVGRGFAKAVEQAKYAIYACAILQEHIHLVIARHERKIKQILSHLKANATRRLTEEGLHPLEEFRDENGNAPSPWAEDAWPVYLDNAAAVRRSIRYAEDNPVKAGLPRQKWSFVVPFEWPHGGNSRGAEARPKGRR